MAHPLNVVVTGGTRGIGFGLARAFLARGHNVCITGRDSGGVARALDLLNADAEGSARAVGATCEVTRQQDLEQLWAFAVAELGGVDHWINNAGRNNPKRRVHEMPVAEVTGTLETNLIGLVRGSLVAFNGLKDQGGWLWNMEGFGSDGMIGLEQVPYGTAKYAVRYFTKALAKTAAGTPVKVGFLSPGIVTTEMAVPRAGARDEFFRKNTRVLNILADHPETVCPWLVERMLAAGKNGTAIRWLTYPKVLGRFLAAPFRRREVIEEAMARRDAAPG